MSLSVLHRRLYYPVNESGRAGIAGVTLDGVPPERHHELRLRREQRIDEELAQSFPASDPPSWVQGTAPVPQ